MDKLLQPFPSSFCAPDHDASVFVAASGEIRSQVLTKMHRHDFYELVWLWQGDCIFFSDFEHYSLKTGTLIFISPGQLHDYCVEKDFCRLFIFGFRPSLLPKVAHHLVNLLPFDDTQQAPVLEIPAALHPHIEQLYTTARERFRGKLLGWDTIVASYLQTVLAEAAYTMPKEQLEQAVSAPTQLTKAFQSALEKHYRYNKQVQDFADMLGVTSNHLVKTVRETTSKTPKQLIQNRLLLESKRLLIHTPYPVGQIGDMLGFPDSTTFARWFKKLSLQTPSIFRQHSPFTDKLSSVK